MKIKIGKIYTWNKILIIFLGETPDRYIYAKFYDDYFEINGFYPKEAMLSFLDREGWKER